jgi:sialate O-acetylesterase
MPTLPVLLLLTTLLGSLTRAAAPATIAVDSPVFQDHMVLQRDRTVPVWGTGQPAGSDVTVSIAGQTKTTTVGPDGKWRVDLEPMPPGGPHRLVLGGTNTIVIDDVLVGDVWLCSGQSNMARDHVRPFEREGYPYVRTLRRNDWEENPSETAWHIGRSLYETQGVPIGIINLAWSGSMVREWLADGAEQDMSPETWAEIVTRAGFLYQQLIAPIVPYAIRGVFWWQGESDLNYTRVGIYEEQLVALIRSWRRAFERDDLPFIYVELPTGRGPARRRPSSQLPFYQPRPHSGVKLFEAYLGALVSEPRTGMAVTKDLGHGLHPVHREPYAERMVLWARRIEYGEDIQYSGPIVESAMPEGNRVRIRFRDGTADGLHAVAPYPLQGFALSEDGQNFEWAETLLDGSDIVVWNDQMSRPTMVRYAWSERSLWANLVNGDEMPAAPFELEVGTVATTSSTIESSTSTTSTTSTTVPEL